MTMQLLFTPVTDGSGFDIQPQAVLLILADAVYGDSLDKTQAGLARGKAVIAAMLEAAQAGGFTRAAELASGLSSSRGSAGVKAMAEQACKAAGEAALYKIFDTMRNKG